MTAIIFRTPGTLDMRAFTTMGVNAKPNSTAPIGFFGTGLKYAVAVLCRLGASFVVHTGGNRYTFEVRPMDFRGSEFQQVVMRRDRWGLSPGGGWKLGRTVRLPFTTQYGRNWEPWMAFRELYSNTLDEGGDALEADRAVPDWLEWNRAQPWGDDEHTLIIIDGSGAFTQAYRDRAAIFVNLADHAVLATLPGVEVREGSTARLFYQGMRAKDLGKPALHTYNFTAGQTLTEDRQLAHEHAVRAVLATAIAQSDDAALIRRVVTADDKVWEHGLQPADWVTPSAAFKAVMASRPRGVGVGWGGYYGRHDDRPEVARRNPWTDALRPWRVDGGDVVAADGTPLLSKPYPMNEQHWANLAAHVVGLANRDKGEGPVAPASARPPGAAEASWEDEGGALAPAPRPTPMLDEHGDDVPF